MMLSGASCDEWQQVGTGSTDPLLAGVLDVVAWRG